MSDLLDKPARVGRVIFKEGVSVSAVISAAQRLYVAGDSPVSSEVGDDGPRYSMKRMRLETANARAYGLELAAAYHDDMAAQHEESHRESASSFHEQMGKSHRRDAKAIRALNPTPAPTEAGR